MPSRQYFLISIFCGKNAVAHIRIEWYSDKYFTDSPQNIYCGYGKCPEIPNTLFHTCFLPKFCFFMQLILKILSGMANSVDPDQTAPSGAV